MKGGKLMPVADNRCMNCGYPVRVDSQRCPYCREPIVRCQKCSKPLKKGDKHCLGCGHPMGDD